MSIFKKASTSIEAARENGNRLVAIFEDEAAAIAAGLSKKNHIVIGVDNEIEYRTMSLNSIEIIETANPQWVRLAVIGRDLLSNQTLRFWSVWAADADTPEIGDLVRTPQVFVPFNHFALTLSGEDVKAIKSLLPQGHFHAAAQGQLEVINSSGSAAIALSSLKKATATPE